MQPQYFLPNLSRHQLAPDGRFSPEILRQRGLAHVFADVAGNQDCFIGDVLGNGPGELSGVILCYQRPDGGLPDDTGYHPDRQTWTRITADLWLGYCPADPPTEEDFRRRRQFPGYWYTLREGEAWHIPVVRRPDGTTNLPTDIYIDGAGKLQEPVKRAYQEYWDESAEVASWFFSEAGDGEPKGFSFNRARGLELAVRSISLNYRFGHAEQALIRLIDSENLLTILGASIDLPKVTRIETPQKKTSPSEAPPNTTLGPPEDCPDTALAAAT